MKGDITVTLTEAGREPDVRLSGDGDYTLVALVSEVLDFMRDRNLSSFGVHESGVEPLPVEESTW